MTVPVLPALFLAADAIDTGSQRLMGRQSAGNGFLRGFVQAVQAPPARPLDVICPGGNDTKFVAQALERAGWRHEVRMLAADQPATWGDPGVVYYPAPFSDMLGWQRSRQANGTGSFAFCGITHTISSDAVMRQLAAYVAGPFAAHDALICTSQSVLRAVQSIWHNQIEMLGRRFGARIAPALPMLPVIPLGVHASDFDTDEGARATARQRHGFADSDIVVLFVGRLSLHAKANPLPMYLACARAAKASGKSIRILECGWFANDPIRESFDEAARVAGIRVDRVDGREPGVTRAAYQAADIFVSLSDNIQETFGLTPVEAMAAGLPVVASNWDGYRETVRDGVDGLLIPTRQPENPECAAVLIDSYQDGRLNYDRYVAYAHMLVAVDVEACAAAIAALAGSADLRKRLGESGRRRVLDTFDWSSVLPSYQSLWAEQRERLDHFRKAGGARSQREPGMPNPLQMFAHYPSAMLNGQSRLHRDAAGGVDPRILRELSMWRFAQGWLADAALVETAWQALPARAENAVTLDQWALALKMDAIQAQRLAAWMAKTGLAVIG
jgi:glycosyltransferase involved in cell wall biosynthesis